MLNEKLHSYMERLIPSRNDLLLEMERYAKKHNVPIMELDGMEAMLQILKIKKPKRILEIGTAIGYSALRMAFSLPKTRIITIERDEERYILAEDFIQRSGVGEQISLIKGDALELEKDIQLHAPYDAIFIDAAKGQYKRFFEIYSKYLQEDGIIFSDNVLFKGLVYEQEIESKRTRNLVKKIDDYNQWLMNHPQYSTIILPVGDGVAISLKRGEAK